jgi:hypothetical protein
MRNEDLLFEASGCWYMSFLRLFKGIQASPTQSVEILRVWIDDLHDVLESGRYLLFSWQINGELRSIWKRYKETVAHDRPRKINKRSFPRGRGGMGIDWLT